MLRILAISSFSLLAFLATFFTLFGSPPEQNQSPAIPYSPQIAPASNEPLLVMKAIQVPKGLQIELFAAEPMLANPVCFCTDERGRFYVAETFRIQKGVEDDRDHMSWLDDDLASRTVQDRIALYKKHLGDDKIRSYAVEHERIRRIDVDSNGRAVRSTVFADGFNNIEDGIGAGLLARGGNVWYTCIPNLWLLRDTAGSGKADVHKSLHRGYGVHIGYYGHDLHGLRFGPDGKLYFSIGDRGLNVKTAGRTVANPDSGAVLRCNPDGSELELFATGLRNPQELAFDQYGNLFTGDNNSDVGDLARWVYVVEGGDSGWRMGYQFMDEAPVHGPWMAEQLWKPQYSGQAAYIVPPIANVADGPAGLAYYPGTGLPARYQEHFFLCDFRGTVGNSGIRSFAVKPKGASFEFLDQHQCIWSVLATDVEFGVDGGLYVLDWVEGWVGAKKGRIYKVFDPALAKDAVVQSVKKLLAEGMAHRSLAELAGLLEHPDMRIRQEAQFALADKGAEAIPTLTVVVQDTKKPQLARLHAIWGLSQIGRKNPEALRPVWDVRLDLDGEVRAQALRVLGEAGRGFSREDLLLLMDYDEPRVLYFATLALGKLRCKEAVGDILHMLRENADRDAYLRHAGVMALTWINDRDQLLAHAGDKSASVRMGVLLALRRLGCPEVARFLNDPEPRLVLEAGRAIYDVPILAAMPQLAALISRTGLEEPLLWRVLNANFRLGTAKNAAAVAAFAGRPDAPESLRIEALRELGDWERPSGRDRVVGLWRPLQPRPANLATDALRPVIARIFKGTDKVRQEATKLAAKLGIKEAGPLLYEILADKSRLIDVRIETLKGLEMLHDERLPQAIQLALADGQAKLRTEGRRILARVKPEDAPATLEKALEHGEVIEQQGALSILAELRGPQADALLSRWLDKLLARKVPLEIQLDLLEASARRPATHIKEKLARYEAARPKNDPLAKYREALAGGDAEAGRKIFYNKAEVSCQRCHKIKGEGGEVGPDLTGIGNRQKRDYLLQSIVDPNKDIAKGFETVVLTLDTGQFLVGIVKAEDDKELRLITAEGKLLTVAKNRIEERARGKSAMPEDLVKFLSKSDLRNLVEFLASLK